MSPVQYDSQYNRPATKMVPVDRLEVGTVVWSDDKPYGRTSDLGFVHRVDSITEIGQGCTRVHFDVTDDKHYVCSWDRLYWDGDDEVEVVDV